MRVDLWLHRCRFARTRSLAQALIETGHMRCNGAHITRSSQQVAPGDVLTFAQGHGRANRVRVIEILGLPERRGPARESQTYYRELDPAAKSAIAADETTIAPRD